jgi:signal transduction histidine kinase
VTITVSDTGTGMSPDVVARAFELFFTTKKEGHGTGLGLSAVYGYTRASGGTATIRSVVGQGTAVKLYLPRAAGASASEASEQRAKATGL